MRHSSRKNSRTWLFVLFKNNYCNHASLTHRYTRWSISLQLSCPVYCAIDGLSFENRATSAIQYSSPKLTVSKSRSDQRYYSVGTKAESEGCEDIRNIRAPCFQKVYLHQHGEDSLREHKTKILTRKHGSVDSDCFVKFK